MIGSAPYRRLFSLVLLFPLLVGLGLTACHRSSPKPTVNLDTVFTSPTGRYTIRVDHTWPEQEIAASQGRILDYFTLPNGAFSVITDAELPGTTLDKFVQSTLDQYRSAHVQRLERAGSIEVGPGRGELLKARTYVDARGQTAFSPPAPNATPRTLYQAFYVAGDVGFTFSIVWPENVHTDFLSLFRSMLRTFTLAGAT